MRGGIGFGTGCSGSIGIGTGDRLLSVRISDCFFVLPEPLPHILRHDGAPGRGKRDFKKAFLSCILKGDKAEDRHKEGQGDQQLKQMQMPCPQKVFQTFFDREMEFLNISGQIEFPFSLKNKKHDEKGAGNEEQQQRPGNETGIDQQEKTDEKEIMIILFCTVDQKSKSA